MANEENNFINEAKLQLSTMAIAACGISSAYIVYGSMWALASGTLATLFAASVKSRHILNALRSTDDPDDPDVILDGGYEYHQVQQFARKAGFPTPPLLLLKKNGKKSEKNRIFAGAIGAPSNGAIFVNEAFMNNLSRKQKSGVLAHEMIHIKYDDAFRNLANLAYASVGYITYGGMAFSSYTGVGKMPNAIEFNQVACLTLAVSILGAYYSRVCEKRADREAIYLTQNPWAYVSALKHIGKDYNQSVDGFKAAVHSVVQYYAPHPSLRSRVNMLEKDLTSIVLKDHPQAGPRLQKITEIEISRFEKECSHNADECDYTPN